MTKGSAASVTIDIKRMLDCLPSTPSIPSIYRIDSHLRSSGGKNVYEPEILSVGPFYHGIPKLQNMEHHKYRYIKQLLDRRNEQTVDRYATAMAAMENEARKCYAEPLDLDENAFVRLMVLDGLFLVELFRSCAFKYLRDKDDPIFRHERILSQLCHDILLLENQLPFFVLNQLFHMTKTDENSDVDLVPLVLHFVDGMFLKLSASQVLEKLPAKNFDHLCGLIHNAWCLPFAEAISHGYISKTNNEAHNWDNIKSVSRLREAEIKLRKAPGSNNLMDIKFVNGILKIPQLSISDETESQFRNLIAYEQYLLDGEPRYVSDYIFFMYCLIKSSHDVELLRRGGIIENYLGNDAEACLMFNRLGRNILTSSSFCYSQVFCSVDKHCRHPFRMWKAELRRTYFNNPWAMVSFLAALTLLLLTLIQTAFAVLAFYDRTG